ncbi:chromosomal replication initiator protein DnaA [Candidatus Saccharibacteria bacterium]|nr:chromosomal replication initiator protein DnaA [Candidatus Saccharibacteria bacterium]
MQDNREIWKNTISCLETELSKAVVGAFFSGTALDSFDDGVAVVSCPNRLSTEYLKHRYGAKIEETLSTLSGISCTASFAVKKVASAKAQELGPIFKSGELDGLVSSYTFESFVVGLSNQLATSVAQAVVERPGNLHNPLFLHSGVGLGKTHLLHAVGNAIKERDSKTRVLYTPSERFTNELIKAIQDKRSTSSFRRRYRQVDVLLVDDIQFLAGREATQEEFFNTFNELYLSGKQIVLTSDRHPSGIKRLEERLVSRFSGGMVADIQTPDLDMKMEILKRKAAEQGATLQDEVVLEIAEHITGSIRQLEGLLQKLLAVSSAHGVSPTKELISALLPSASAGAAGSPEDIVSTVCKRFNVEESAVKSEKRTRTVVTARHVAAYLLRDLSSLSLKDIGGLLGDRDHTTVLYGVDKIEKELRQNTLLKNQIDTLRVEILGKTA